MNEKNIAFYLCIFFLETKFASVLLNAPHYRQPDLERGKAIPKYFLIRLTDPHKNNI